MLKPDPSQRRQLAADGPMLLWRDRQGGGREGLALSAHACSNPECNCRKIMIEGWSVGANLSGFACTEGELTFVINPGPEGERERRVLWAAVDLDDGAVTPVVAKAKTGAPSKSDPWAVEWLRSEMDGPLLETLRERFRAEKSKPRPPHDWRKDDWSWWEPGMEVGWNDVHSDADDNGDILLDGKIYVVGDYYCVEPGCDCEEARLAFWLVPAPNADFEDVGDVWVNPTIPGSAQFHAHGSKRTLLKRLWAAWSERKPISTLLLQRQKELRELAPEIHKLFGKHRPVAAGPNDRCPCGSGKKYKRCCMRS